jgi:hypothetical protein
MKKLAYLLVFIFASASLLSCGASNSSCATSDTYIIKNMKFENQEYTLNKKFKKSDEIVKFKNQKYTLNKKFKKGDDIVKLENNE